MLLPSSGGVALRPPLVELITPVGAASRGSAGISALAGKVAAAVDGGVNLVQLRDPTSSAADAAALAAELRYVTRGKSLFVINGDPTLAVSCDADGVHLPERMIGDLSTVRFLGAARGDGKRSGKALSFLIGCSVHSVAAAAAAAAAGADYVQVGTMFETASHPGKEPEGTALMAAVCAHLRQQG
ncbi:unnamed protein product, partial [Phaeothamnion confervicola]